MKKRYSIVAAIVLSMALLAVVSSFKAHPVDKGGWFPAGSHPEEYKMTIVSGTKHSGSHAALIEYTGGEKPSGFGTYMQMHKPGAWAGKKIKMTGYVKTENIEGWCGMWCRVDDASGKDSYDFYNMGDHPIKGTTDWTKYEIMVNVPNDASAVAYGLLVNGKGMAYFDDVSFEVLGPAENHPVHGKPSMLPDKGENFDFEQ